MGRELNEQMSKNADRLVTPQVGRDAVWGDVVPLPSSTQSPVILLQQLSHCVGALLVSFKNQSIQLGGD